MRKVVYSGAAATVLFWFVALPGAAKDIVINDGFEMRDITYWEFTGTIKEYGVVKYEVAGPLKESWCFWTRPWDKVEGTLAQWVYVIAGVTYEVSMDICYHAG